MNFSLMPPPKQQFLNSQGAPLVGGKVYTYAAGTTNPKATYTDSAGKAQQQNPIPLNARGEPAAPIFWSGNYRVDLYDAAGNLVYTVDNYNTDAWANSLGAAAGAGLVGYQPGNGGAPTTLETALHGLEWLRDVAKNIKDPQFNGGAKGGGVDDTAVIQMALNAAAGGVLDLPAGVFTVTTLTVPANTTIRGHGNRTELKRKDGASAGPILKASGATKITVSDLALNGNRSACTGGDANLYFDGVGDCTIERVYSYASVGHGLSLQHSVDGANGTASTIRNCVITDAAGYGIEAQDSSHVAIVGNRVSKTGSYGILVYGSVAYAVQGALVEGNFVSQAGATGIGLPFVNGGTAFTPGVGEATVVGNHVERSAHNGYIIQARFATVTGNTSARNGTTISHQGFCINVLTVTLTGNTSTGNAGVGIDFGDCKRVIATGNLVQENGIIGIEINSTEDYCVTGNMLIENNQTAMGNGLNVGILAHKGTGGYTFEGGTMNGVISNNVVRGGPNQQFGIKVTADNSNVRLIGNDALASGSVRDFEILAPSGQFIQSGNTTSTPTLAGDASVTIPQVGDFFYVNPGAGPINSIVTDGATYEIGRRITLKFNGPVTVNNGTGNIYLNGAPLNANNGSVLMLVRADAGGWIETSRRL